MLNLIKLSIMAISKNVFIKFFFILFLVCSCSPVKNLLKPNSEKENQDSSKIESSKTQLSKDKKNPSILTKEEKKRNISQFTVKKVRIAAVLPLSGKNKELGTSILNSITLALFENDKTNIIDLLVFDSEKQIGNLPNLMTEIARSNIRIVIGPIFGNNVEEIADSAISNGITVFSFSNNQDLLIKHSGKGIFLLGFSPEQQIERIAAYAINAGGKNMAIIAPNNQYGFKFAKILNNSVKNYGGNFVTGQFYSDNSKKELQRVVLQTLNATVKINQTADKKLSQKIIQDINNQQVHTNAILIPESGEVLAKIASIIHQFNQKNADQNRVIQIIGSSNWDDVANLSNSDLFGGWFVGANPSKFSNFEKRYYQVYNQFPLRISSIGYDITASIIEVAKQLNNKDKDLTADNFINYQSPENGFDDNLKGVFTGIDGSFRFLPSGVVQRSFAILEIRDNRFVVMDEAGKAGVN